MFFFSKIIKISYWTELMWFQVFDKHNRGYISASDLRAVLQCLGEDLSEEESKYLYVMFKKKYKLPTSYPLKVLRVS